MYAVARNVEDLEAAKVTSMIPAVNLTHLSKQNSTSLRSRMASSVEDSSVSVIPLQLFLFSFFLLS